MTSICVIGGGPAGICAGVKIKTELKYNDFTIFESNQDFGGSWFSHTYPNCETDVPSHIYSFSFAQKSDWTSVYAKQPEMGSYLQDVATKYGLYSHAKFNQCVTMIEWVEEKNHWKVMALNKNTEQMEAFEFDVVISAVGYFLLPRTPEIFKFFKGTMMHSAEWNHSISLNDKTVAVVGSGPSAVQVIPGIAKDVKKLYSFQRRPGYVIPKPQFDISSTTKFILNKFPFLMIIIRTFLSILFESSLFVLAKNSRRNKLATYLAKRFNRGPMLSTKKRAQLEPNIAFGTTQPAFSNDYYPAMANQNVEIVSDKIVKIEGNTIFTSDGEERVVDAVILTTGYHQTYQFCGKNFPIRVTLGDNDISSTVWGKADNYLSLMKAQVPNLFMVGGPNAGLAHHSHFFAVECGANWITKVLIQMKNQSCHKVVLKEGVQKEYMNKLEKEKKKWVMIEDPEKEGLRGAENSARNGASSILCPWGAFRFWNKLRKVQFDHLQFS